MKIYTRTGDDGTTALASGQRVPKDDLQVEAYGTLDELSSHLGLLAVLVDDVVAEHIRSVQREIVCINGWVAGSTRHTGVVAENVSRLEMLIDELNPQPLDTFCGFLLPGSSQASAQAHVSRTVCRRAERRLCSVLHHGRLNVSDEPHVPVYLNRLSDYLYALACRLASDAKET